MWPSTKLSLTPLLFKVIMMDEVSCETGGTRFKTVSSTGQNDKSISGNFRIPRPYARGVSKRKPQNLKAFPTHKL